MQTGRFKITLYGKPATINNEIEDEIEIEEENENSKKQENDEDDVIILSQAMSENSLK
jgi:hypothetical protein